MTRSRIDALLILSPQNYEYVSGHRSMAWLIPSRPLAVILPRDAAPVAIVASSQEPCVRPLGIITDVHPYQGFEDDAVRAVVESLQRLGLSRAVIGAELGREQRLGVPVACFDMVRQFLPRAHIVDASDTFWQARMSKSPAEIACLRRSGATTGDAYRGLLERLHTGWRERDVYAAFAESVMRAGADRPGYVTMTNGPGSYACYCGWPSGRPLVSGELFWMDAGCVVDSYWSDYTRCIAIGHASPVQEHFYREMVQVLRNALGEVRPGARVDRIVDVAAAGCQHLGFPMKVASRVGHGTGLVITEPPSIAPNDATVLREGMAITIEPAILTDAGWFHLEENLIVTGEGYELLSAPMPDELPVVP